MIWVFLTIIYFLLIFFYSVKKNIKNPIHVDHLEFLGRVKRFWGLLGWKLYLFLGLRNFNLKFKMYITIYNFKMFLRHIFIRMCLLWYKIINKNKKHKTINYNSPCLSNIETDFTCYSYFLNEIHILLSF